MTRHHLDSPPDQTLSKSDVVVAVVNARPLTAHRVANHARSLGKPPREALADLISFELLAQEASRRGLASDPEVQETRRTESVRRLLKIDFEPRHRPEDISETELRREYERNRRHFEHPEILSILSALFSARRGKATAAEDLRARARAHELYERLRVEQPKNAATAREIVKTFEGQVPMRIDEFNTYRGAPADRDWLKAALTLRQPGQISPPVRSEYGWHVIFLAEFHPAKRTPEAEALATIRREMHPLWSRAAFSRFVDEIFARHAITMNSQLLDAPRDQPGQ
jgi:peptidyl-prolyl cis-trans isomerase C